MNLLTIIILLINAGFILFAFLIQEYFKVFLFNRISPSKKNINVKALFDPIGVLLIIIFQIGWIIPTELNFFLVENRKKGIILVHGLPVLLNLILGFLFLGISIVFQYKDFEIISLVLQIAYTSQFTVFALSILPFHTMAFYRIYYFLASPTSKVKMMTNSGITNIIFALLIFMGIISMYTNFVTKILTNLFLLFVV